MRSHQEYIALIIELENIRPWILSDPNHGEVFKYPLEITYEKIPFRTVVCSLAEFDAVIAELKEEDRKELELDGWFR